MNDKNIRIHLNNKKICLLIVLIQEFDKLENKIKLTSRFQDTINEDFIDDGDELEDYNYNNRKRNNKNKMKSLWYHSGYRKTLYRGCKQTDKQKRAKKKSERINIVKE